MPLENSIRIMAGLMILISAALTYFVSPWWLFLTAFVGLNLIQSAFTKFCPAEMLIGRLFYSGRDKKSGRVSSQEA